MNGYVEEMMLYSLILFVETGCTSKVNVSIIDRQDDSTNHEKRVCSGRGFQHTCLLYIIYIAVGMSIGIFLFT